MKEILGLLKKDWALMAKQMRMLAIYLVVLLAIFSFTLSDMLFLVSFFSVLLFMMSTNCFAYDEQVSFGKLLAASPLSPRTVVLSRYLLSFLVGLAGASLITLLNLALSSFRPEGGTTLEAALAALLTSVGIAVLLMSVLFPLFYKFGVNKSRLMILLVCAIPIAAVALLKFLVPEELWEGFAIPAPLASAFPFLLAALLILAAGVSIRISIGIVRNQQYA